MTALLNFGRDVQGMNAYAPDFPSYIYTATLSQGVDESITVPSLYKKYIMYVIIQPQSRVWVSNVATAAVPFGSSFTTSNSELIVSPIEYKRIVYSGDVISFLTPNTTCDTSVIFYPTR